MCELLWMSAYFADTDIMCYMYVQACPTPQQARKTDRSKRKTEPIESNWPVHGRLMASSWPAHGQFMANSWPAHGQFMANSWPVHGQFMA
eukprot:3311026-Lingulodinium_polyedra.AAC.1